MDEAFGVVDLADEQGFEAGFYEGLGRWGWVLAWCLVVLDGRVFVQCLDGYFMQDRLGESGCECICWIVGNRSYEDIIVSIYRILRGGETSRVVQCCRRRFRIFFRTVRVGGSTVGMPFFLRGVVDTGISIGEKTIELVGLLDSESAC